MTDYPIISINTPIVQIEPNYDDLAFPPKEDNDNE